MHRVETVGDDTDASVEALPPEFLAAFAELRAALEVAPWTGRAALEVAPWTGRAALRGRRTPSGSRTAIFGPQERAMVLYVVGEHDPSRDRR